MKTEFVDRLEKEPDCDYLKLMKTENSNSFDIEFDFLTKTIIIKGYEFDGKLYAHHHEFKDLLSIHITDPKILEKILKKEPLEGDNYWCM